MSHAVTRSNSREQRRARILREFVFEFDEAAPHTPDRAEFHRACERPDHYRETDGMHRGMPMSACPVHNAHQMFIRRYMEWIKRRDTAFLAALTAALASA